MPDMVTLRGDHATRQAANDRRRTGDG